MFVGDSFHSPSLRALIKGTLLEKKSRPGTTEDDRYVHSTTLLWPFRPRSTASENSAPAYAIDSVAEPLPAWGERVWGDGRGPGWG